MYRIYIRCRSEKSLTGSWAGGSTPALKCDRVPQSLIKGLSTLFFLRLYFCAIFAFIGQWVAKRQTGKKGGERWVWHATRVPGWDRARDVAVMWHAQWPFGYWGAPKTSYSVPSLAISSSQILVSSSISWFFERQREKECLWIGGGRTTLWLGKHPQRN